MPGFDAIGAAPIGGILINMDGAPYLSIQDARSSISTLFNAVQDNRVPISSSLAVLQDGRTRIFYIDFRRMPVVRLYSKGPTFINFN